jgi:hypothetical protein
MLYLILSTIFSHALSDFINHFFIMLTGREKCTCLGKTIIDSVKLTPRLPGTWGVAKPGHFPFGSHHASKVTT